MNCKLEPATNRSLSQALEPTRGIIGPQARPEPGWQWACERRGEVPMAAILVRPQQQLCYRGSLLQQAQHLNRRHFRVTRKVRTYLATLAASRLFSQSRMAEACRLRRDRSKTIGRIVFDLNAITSADLMTTREVISKHLSFDSPSYPPGPTRLGGHSRASSSPSFRGASA